MRPGIILGTALTTGVMTSIADLIGSFVAADQVSVTTGVVVRSILVVAALLVTAAFWWLRMKPEEPPVTLVVGMVVGWALNPSSWAGASFAGQLFTNVELGALLIDIVLWAIVSLGIVSLLAHTSPVPTRR